MFNIADLVLQAEMDYRLERTRQAWGTLRRRQEPRREGRNSARRRSARDTLA